MAAIWDSQRWPNFSHREMACRCGCGLVPTPKFMDWLQFVRNDYDDPMIVTSGARCYLHNHAVGGAPGSAHTKGLAADIRISGASVGMLLKLAIYHGVTGIGLKQHGAIGARFIHLDIMDRGGDLVVWTYA